MGTSISAGVGDLPCFPTFSVIPIIELKIPIYTSLLTFYDW